MTGVRGLTGADRRNNFDPKTKAPAKYSLRQKEKRTIDGNRS